MEVAFKEIEKEFSQTFGYMRQDINALLQEDCPLHYTVALIVCCACEMLTWYRDLRDDQAYQVFTSLLPDTESYRAVGKTLWEALRNGLAHNFRPDTIRIEDEEWRFSIYSQPGPHMSVTKGKPNWIRLNIRSCSSRVISQIDAYEQELRTKAAARVSFFQKSESYIKTIPAEACTIAGALRSITREIHS